MDKMRNDGYDIARDVNKSIANKDQELYDTISKYGYNQDFATFRRRVATESGYRKRVYDSVAKAGFNVGFGFDEWDNDHVLDHNFRLDRISKQEKPIRDWVDVPLSGSSETTDEAVGSDDVDWLKDGVQASKPSKEQLVAHINNQLKKLDEDERGIIHSEEYKKWRKSYDSDLSTLPGLYGFHVPRFDRKDTEEEFPAIASIRRQRQELEKQLQTIKSADGKDDAWYKKLGRGALNAVTTVGTWDMGMGQLEDIAGVNRIVNKIKVGKPLEDYEMDELSTLAASTFVNSEYGKDISNWEKIGGGVVESVPFMLEMFVWGMMSGGTGSIGAAATKFGGKQAKKILLKSLGKEGYKKLIESTSGKILRGLGKGALRVGGDAVQSVAMANTTGAARTTADALDRQMGTAMPTLDAEGNIHYAGHEGGVGLGEAIFKAEAAQTIEYASEMAGEYFEPLGKLVGKGFNKLPANRLTNSIRRGVRKASNSGAVRYSRELGNAVHFNSPVGETAEEYVGGLMNALIVGDQTLDADPETGLFTREMFNQTVGVTGVTSLLFLGIGGVRYGGVRAKVHHQLKASDKAGKEVFGEEWDGIKKSIEGRSLEELNDYYNYVEANAESEEQSDVIQRYVRAYLANVGTQIGGALGIKEEVNEQLDGARREMQVRLSESDKNGERLFGEVWADVKADIEGRSSEELDDLYNNAEDYTQVEGGADAIREYILAYKTTEANNVSAKREMPVSDKGATREDADLPSAKEAEVTTVRDGVASSEDSSMPAREDSSMPAREDSGMLTMEDSSEVTREDSGKKAIEAASMDPAVVGEAAFNTEGYRAGVRSEVVGELGGEEAVHNGAVTTVGIKGLFGDFTLVGGDFKVTSNERGGLELEGDRDGVVYYRDSDGAVKPTLLGDIGDVKSSVDVEEEVSARVDAAREAYRANNAIVSEQSDVLDDTEETENVNGDGFALNSSGGIDFGEVTSEMGLPAAPIRMNENSLEHIESRHGDEIRGAGFSDAREFIEYVSSNFTRIKEGTNAEGSPNGTYLLQVEGKHNDTLYVEFTIGGGYWNVNSGGVFNGRYGDNKRTIWSASVGQNKASEPVNTSPSTEQGRTTADATRTVSISSSQGKGSENVGDTKSDPSREVTDRGDQVTDPARVVGGRDYKGDEKLGGEQVNEGSVDNVGQGVTEEVPGEQAMLGALEELEGRFGVQITVHRDASSIRERSVREAIEAGDTVKGWYNTRDRSVHVYLPQAEGVGDITSTYLHEVVAHYGMRALLGEEKYNGFLEILWGKLDAEERSAAMKAANMEGMSADELSLADIRLACDEYVASIAERGDFEGKDRATWRKMVDAMLEVLGEFLDKLGVSDREAVSIVEDLLSMSARNLERTAGKVEGNLSSSTEVANGSRVNVREDGSKDYVGAGVEATIDDLFMETGNDAEVVDSAVQAGISEAEAKVKEAEAEFEKRKKKVKGVQGVIALANERKATMSRLEGEVKFWKEVWDKLHPKEEASAYKLSDKVDSKGNHFVLNSRGEEEFGEIRSDMGLEAGPIRLSEGANDDSTNWGYGLKHIIARHGDEIASYGYKSVIDYVEAVAKGFTTIRRGKIRANGKSTYILEMSDGKSKTLFVELSDNGGYYEVNSAGVFRPEYAKNKELIWTEPAVGNSVTTDTAESDTQSKGSNAINGNAPQISSSESKGSDNVGDVQEASGVAPEERVDINGNAIDEEGRLVVDRIESIDELTDEDFENPTRSVELPKIPANVDSAIGADGKSVVIKKNIFEKNRERHRDLSAIDSRRIIGEALYNPNLYGNNQKNSRPYNWILIHTKDRLKAIVLEVSRNKDNVEVVNWHYLDEKTLAQKERQAIKEGGLILSLESEAGNALNSSSSESKGSDNVGDVQEASGVAPEERVDINGNAIDEQGRLMVDRIDSIDELTDEDFESPTRSVELPKIPANVDLAIGAGGKPVVIKKNIFEKNRDRHKFSASDSRAILKRALYDTDLIGQSQPISKPNYWVAIKVDSESPLVILEVNRNKDNVEIVGWYSLDDRNLDRIKRQADREGGELLILSKDTVDSLSTPTADSLPSESKGSDNVVDVQEEGASSEDRALSEKSEKTAQETEQSKETERPKITGKYRLTRSGSVKNALGFLSREQRSALPNIPLAVNNGVNGYIAILNGYVLIYIPTNENGVFAITTKSKGEVTDVSRLFKYTSILHPIKSYKGKLPEHAIDIKETKGWKEYDIKDLYEQVVLTIEERGLNVESVHFELLNNGKSISSTVGYVPAQNLIGMLKTLYSLGENSVKLKSEPEQQRIVFVSGSNSGCIGLSYGPSSAYEGPDMSIELDNGRVQRGATEAEKQEVSNEPEEGALSDGSDKSDGSDGSVKMARAGRTGDVKKFKPRKIKEGESIGEYASALAKENAEASSKENAEASSKENAEASSKENEEASSKENEEASSKENEEASSKERIEDYGEKFGGAAKDLYKEAMVSFHREVGVDDLKANSLSKVFPRPKLGELVEEGSVSQENACLVEALYNEIGNKPRTRRVVGWAKSAKEIRDLIVEILDNPLKDWSNDARISEYTHNDVKLLKALNFQANDVNVKGIKISNYVDTHKGINDYMVTGLNGTYGYTSFKTYEEAVSFVAKKLEEKKQEKSQVKQTKTNGGDRIPERKDFKVGQYRPDDFVVYYDDPYTKAQIQIRRDFKTAEEAFGYVESNIDSLIDKYTNAPSIVVATNPNNKSIAVYISKPKNKSRNVLIRDGFKSWSDARLWVQENYDDLKGKAKDLEGELNESWEARERVGADHRQGVDVGAESFVKDFGFRGVEFGNWVNQKERQDALNSAYDGLMDLCELIGVSPRALSLNGRLGLAFGSRGRSKAMAHYEPDKKVINLTKMKGSGSLVHEWLHALDNYFSGEELKFASDGRFSDEVRKEMQDAWNGLTDAISKSNMAERSKSLDTWKNNVYWGTRIELAARAFQGWVKDRIERNGGVSDYLNNYFKGEDNYLTEKFYPYPLASEDMNAVYDAFDHLFDTMEERIDEETGNAVLFRRNSEELEGIKKRAVAEGRFMKAPNGEPTKLNEDQWLEVRSRAFKDWFGDWEKPFRIEKLRNSEDSIIAGDEVIPNDDIKVYKKNALQYGKKLRDFYTNKDTGSKIAFTKSGIQEVLNHDYKNKEQLQSIAAIPQIIEKSIYIDTWNNEDRAKNPDVKLYHYYIGGLRIGDVDYTARMVVAERNNGEQFYDHKLSRIEKTKLLDSLSLITTQGFSQEANEVGSPLSDVKDTKLLSILKTDYSKVVDENGEPLVMYHGTPNKDFFKFDIDKPSLNGRGEGKGFYFIADYDIAKKYAGRYGRVIPAFLNARRFWSGFDSLSPEEKKIYLSELNDEKAYDKLGIDAFHVGGQLIVRRPNQIKSATDNVGSFSRESDDIRFRRSLNGANSKQKQAGGTKVELDDDVLFRLTKRGKSSVEGWLKKREDLTNEEREAFMQYLEPMDNNLAMATGWWYAKGVIRVPEDQSKVDDAVEVAKRAKVDPLRYGSPMEVLDTFKEYKIKGEAIDPESVPQLSGGRNVGDASYGIRIYDVEDSKAGQQAMREIINTHWGEDANPWCLLQGDGKGNLRDDAWKDWNHYNGVPKRVAFKDGKLLVFCANNNNEDCWWDRQDDPHGGIPVDMKMPNDELGREATYEISSDGTLGNPINVHRGNKQNGVYEEWLDKEQLWRRTTFKNGQRNGVREVWHFNGQFWLRENYKDGKLDGLREEWYDDGELKCRENYKNEELNGISEEWDINGQIRTRKHYKDGNSEGLFERWYPNGNLESRENYKDNTLDGVSEQWHENGVLKQRETFSGGSINGLKEEWYKNGQLRVRSNWKNNSLDGLYEEWDQSGNLTVRSIYKGYELVEDLTDDVRFRRNSEELEGIKKRAEAEGRFMKAPNGEATKLNEEQWLEVRSRAFKDWFGDWELPHQEVKVVEANSDHGFENLKEARTWAKENIARVYSDEETGGKGDIRISRSAIDKYLSESAITKSENTNVHLSVLKVLPEVIREGIDAETHLDYIKGDGGVRSPQNGVNEGVTIHRLYGAVDIARSMYRVKVTLKVFDDPNEVGKPYSYEAIKIELLKSDLVDTDGTNPRDSNSISVAKLLKDVEKSYEKGKYLLDDYSKVVDENGEPLVVYHGTQDYDFNVFNGASFFTDNYMNADGYASGERIIDAYLSLKNPLILDVNGKKWNNLDTKYGASTREIVNTLSTSHEFDGVIFKNINDNWIDDEIGDISNVYVAFYSNQIKSATDNVGSFSGESDDIRFRRSRDIEAVNERFNEELEEQIAGKQKAGHVYQLGMPSDVLRSAGVPDLPIELYANRLKAKSEQANHPFDMGEIQDLPKKVQKPMAVFRSATRLDSFVIMLELEHKGKNYVVAIQANKQKGRIEVNDIRSIHYRSSNTHFVNWIKEDLLEYVDKEKMLEWLSKQQYNSAEVRNLFKHSTKVVKDFENPKLEGSDIRFRRGRDIEAVNERFNEELEEQIAGKQQAGHVYQLGMPSDVLRSAGVPDLPIELAARTLNIKSQTSWHKFNLSLVRDLPRAIQIPIMVFDSHTVAGSKVVLTELKDGDNNFVAVLKVSEGLGSMLVNDIRSVYPKDHIQGVIDWINAGNLLRYADKEKALDWLNSQHSYRTGTEIPIKGFVSATKVVKEFENPKLEGSNVRFRKAGNELKKREGEGLGEYAERMQRYHEANGRVSEASRVGEKPIYKGGSIGEYAQEVTAYNDDPRVLLRGVGSVSIPKAPEVTSKMSIADVAKEMNDYHHRVREVNKRLEEDMRKCRSVSGRFKYNFVDRAAALETFNESMRASGIDVPPELDAYSDMMRSAGMSNIQLDKARFDVLNPLEEELSRHSKLINKSETFKGLRLEFRDKETGELLEGGDEAVSAFRIEGLYLQALDIIEAEELGLVGRGRSGFSEGVVIDGKSVTPEEFVKLYEGVVGFAPAERLQSRVKSCTDYILDICRAGGLIGEEAYREYRSGRMHYVPQRSWEKRGVSGLSVSDVLDRVASGSVFNPAVIEAKGRESLASNPLPFISNILQSSIFSMRANATKQKMLEWVERNYKELSDMGVVGLRRVYYVAKTDPVSGEVVRNEAGEVVYVMTTTAPSSEMLEKDTATRKLIKEVKKEISDLKKELKSGKIEEEAYDEQIDELESRLKELEDSIVVKFRGGDAPIEDVLTGGEKARNMVTVLRDGVEYQLQFNSRYGGDLVADVLNRNWATKAIADNWITRGVGKVTRKMSSLMTQYNPFFASANLIRDFGFASISNLTDYGVGYQARFMKNMVRVSKAVTKYVIANEAKRTNIDGDDGTLKAYLREYFDLGAQTGWSYLPSVEELGKDMQRAVDPTTMQKVGNVVFWTNDKIKAVLSGLTEVSELTTRFAAYVTARETMNKDGQPRWSKEECAMMSKELTTNFDRRGAMSGVLGSMFGFFNASVQGTKALARLANRNKGKVAGAVSLFTILGFIQALLQPDDDDDDVTLLPFSEWDLMTNLCIGDYKIPLPHGFRGFWGFGTQLGLYARGEKSLTDAVYNGLNSLVNALVPEQVASALEVLCSYNEMTGELGPDAIKLTRLLPSASLPWVEVWTNRDFRGMPISRKPYSTRDEASDMVSNVSMSRGQASEFMTAIAEGLFELAGGDPDSGSRMKRDGSGMVPWWVDFNSSQMEHIWDGYSGVGKVVLDVMDYVVRKRHGDEKPFRWNDLQIAKPFTKRNVGDFKLSEREMLDVRRQNGYLKELLRKTKDPRLVEEMEAPLNWGMDLDQAYNWAMENGTYAQKVYLQKLMSDSVLKGYEDGNLSGDVALRIGKELSRNYRTKVMK